MAAPTNCYVNYATGTGHGNDYKGATFTDGAYVSLTKTLTKAGAFAATKVNHWLYLESNDGGSIVAGFYKVADVTGAPNAVVLATDAGAGSDDDAAKCVQHDGTTSLPWRSIQGALDLITRDATNGDQINVKAGTAQVNQAALATTTYGTPAEGVPLVIRGYTTAAGDGGIGEIDCNGATMWSTTPSFSAFVELEIHNFGNNTGIAAAGSGMSLFYKCEIHKGASTPSGKALLAIQANSNVIGCYVHDSGATGTGISGSNIDGLIYGNYVYNCPNGINGINIINNIVVDCAVGIYQSKDGHPVIGNTVYSSTENTGIGIDMSLNATSIGHTVALNNIIEGYSGAGGVGLANKSDIILLGYNAFFNNTTPKSHTADVIINLGTDIEITGATSPFTNAAAGDFSLNTAVAGAIDGAFPGAWPGLATTTDHADIGAVQAGAGAAGGGGFPILRGSVVS